MPPSRLSTGIGEHEDVAAQVVRDLRAAGMKVAFAESFTAGLATHHLVDSPDAGDVVTGGVVTYAPEAKQRLLGVEPGPVISAACAQQMAVGVQSLFGTECALAFTGVAGPETQEDQPVGTVFVAAACGKRVQVVQCELSGEPNEIRDAAIACGLRLLRDVVTEAR